MNWLDDDDTIEQEIEPKERQQSAQPKTITANARASAAGAATTTAVSYSNTCCGRLRAELNPRQEHFSAHDNATGRDFDIPESFAPRATLAVFLWKLVVTVTSIATLVWGWLDGPGNYFLIYSTHWGLFFVCLYFMFSFLNTVMAERTPQSIGWRIKVTWIVAQVAAHYEAMVFINYWYLVHDWDDPADDLDYFNIAVHGGLAILLYVDVFCVNRIPFRWFHWICYVLPAEMLYVLWTVLHAFVGDLGNEYLDGSSGDPETNDDLIYEFLDWENDWQEAAAMSAINLFAVGPVVFLILWLFSIYQWPCCCRKDRRRYLDSFRDDNQNTGPTVNDVEEGSIFQRWR